MALTYERRLNLVAAAWGLAEATLFFIVPDVLLTAAAMHRLRSALHACVWTVAGALIGGTVTYSWGAVDPESARWVLDLVPGISEAMQEQVGRTMAEHGLAALFLGPLTGTPYKLYAVAAGQQGADPFLFLLTSVPARAIRFVLVVMFARTACRMPVVRRSPNSAMAVWAGCWIVFYVGYFVRVGW